MEFERILVTGGAGFIGSHLVDALIAEGYKVTILDNLSTGTLKNIEFHVSNGSARLVRGDVRNALEVKEAFSKVDGVFHLAAITSVPYSIKNPTETAEVNVQGTNNLLEASADSNVKRFVFVSSCAVYGESKYLPIDENHPTDTRSPYAESKLEGEQDCTRFQEEYGLPTVILRLFNVYGPRQGTSEYSGVITRFLTRIRDGEAPIIFGDGRQTRDFAHISDVVQALLLSANNKDTAGQTFNIGFGKSTTINELCQLILKKMRVELKPLHREPRPGDIKRSWANITKAQRILGYMPRVLLERGLEDITN